MVTPYYNNNLIKNFWQLDKILGLILVFIFNLNFPPHLPIQDNMVNGVKVFATPLHTQACPVTIMMPDKYLKLEKDDSEEDKGQPTYTTSICRGPQQDRLQSQQQLWQMLSFRSSVDEDYFQVLSNG